MRRTPGTEGKRNERIISEVKCGKGKLRQKESHFWKGKVFDGVLTRDGGVG